MRASTVAFVGYVAICKGVHSFSTGSGSTLNIRDILPGGEDIFEGYHVLKVEENDDEDVVYITSRDSEQERCEDCWAYRAWKFPWDVVFDTKPEESNGLFRRDSDASDYNDTDFESLLPRLPKPPGLSNGKFASVCKGVNVDGVPMAPIELRSYPYPGNVNLAAQFSPPVYDFKEWNDPLSKKWYKLDNLTSLATIGPGNKPDTRSVAVEHILEWQLLKLFIESDREKGKDSICAHLGKFWTKKVEIDTVWPDVEEKDKDGKKKKITVPVKMDEEQAIDWVAHQYPGTKTSPSPYTYEFVHLHRDVNNVKQILWGGKRLSPEVNLKTHVATNYDTMEYDVANNGRTAYTQNEGKCKAVKKLRDVVAVYKYHQEPRVAEIMKAQYSRIAIAFKYLETDVLPKMEFQDAAGDDIQFESIKLGDKWLSWMKDRFESRIDAIEAWLKKYGPMVEKAKPPKVVPRDEFEIAVVKYPPMCGKEKDATKMRRRIDYVIAEYDDRGDWENPLENWAPDPDIPMTGS